MSNPSSEIDSINLISTLREQIASQQQEIERLKMRDKNLALTDQIISELSAALIFPSIAKPNSEDILLRKIVDAAAQIIPSPAASLLLVDESTEELEFVVATGSKGEEVKKFRVPIGHGIAGMVAATGQAMIVNDAGVDSRQATDIADQVGYKPRKLLCVPLIANEKVIGVLELLDSESGYVREDIETLGMFSELCALALELSTIRKATAKGAAISLAGLMSSPENQEQVEDQLNTFFGNTTASTEFKRSAEIAEYVTLIGKHGDRATQTCCAILKDFHDYLLQTRPIRS